jgi:hypothetical protein
LTDPETRVSRLSGKSITRELQEKVDFLRDWTREFRAETEEIEAATEEMKRQEEKKAGTGPTSRPPIGLESIHLKVALLRCEVAELRREITTLGTL